MPIYEYECDRCGHHLEALQKISEEPLVYCPECGEAALRKKVSAAAFRLKGTGWYETDFKNAEKVKKTEAGNEKTEKNKGKQTDKSDKEAVSPSSNSKDATSSDTEKTSSKSEGKPADTSSSSEAKDGSRKSSSGVSPSKQ